MIKENITLDSHRSNHIHILLFYSSSSSVVAPELEALDEKQPYCSGGEDEIIIIKGWVEMSEGYGF